MARTVLLGDVGVSATAPQRLTRSTRASRSLIIVPVRPGSPLGALAREKRTQLRALEAGGMASLQLEVEGRTRLASLLPARESLPEAVARREVRRVFTLHRPRALAVLVERN